MARLPKIRTQSPTVKMKENDNMTPMLRTDGFYYGCSHATIVYVHTYIHIKCN